MKKLLSVFAAAAVLFGFASCSGDMHDSVVSSLYAEGDFCEKVGDTTVRKEFTVVSDTEQRFTFTYKNDMTQWGGGNGTLNFKITRDPSAWVKDWGWKKDISVELPVNGTEWLDLEVRAGANSNPGNIVLKDLADGNSYTLILKYDAPAEKVSIKCTGAVTDYPALKAVIVDDTDGKELTGALSTEVVLVRKAGSAAYNSNAFIPTKDGSVKYYLTNGYLYWGADGKMSTEKPDNSNMIVGEWSFRSDFPDWGRKIYVNAVNFAAYVDDKKPASGIKKELSSDIRIYDTTILAEAALVGSHFGWDGSKLLVKDDDTTYHYDFTAEAAEQTFSVQKVAKSWSARWCGQKDVKVSGTSDWDKSQYISIEANSSVDTPTALTALSYITSGDPEHVKLTSLLKNSKYRLTFSIVGENDVSVKLTLLEYIAPTIPSLEGYALKGSYVSDSWEYPATGWVSFTATATPNQYKVEFTPAGTSVQFGFVKGSEKDAAWVTGGGFTITALDSPFTGSVSSGGNSSISGLEAGTTYVLTITVKDVDGNAEAILTAK